MTRLNNGKHLGSRCWSFSFQEPRYWEVQATFLQAVMVLHVCEA